MKNRLKLFCTVLAAAFMLTACGRAEADWCRAAGNAAGGGHRRNGYGRNLVYL